MNRKIVSLLMLAIMVSPSLTVLVGAAPLTVDTDMAYYAPGEDVEIHGTANPNAIVNITIERMMETIYNFSVSADTDGIYHAIVSLSAKDLPGPYIVIVSADGDTAQASFMVTLTKIPTLAEGLLSQVENSREQVEAAFNKLEAEGVDVPEDALDSYEQGVDAAEEALQLMEEGKYGEAFAKALQALHRFRVALQLIQVVGPKRPTKDTEEAERAIGLKVAIERAYAFLDTVNATAERLYEEGYDVDQIKANLNMANETLAQAEELLSLGDIDSATQKLAEARGILDGSMGLLHGIAKRVKAVKTEKFLEHVEKRIQSLEESINRLEHRLKAGQVVLNALKTTRRKLLMIRTRLTASEVEEVIDDLEDAVEEIEEEVDDLNGRGISVTIRAMNKLEAKIRVMEATAERLARKGKDTSEIEEEIQSAKAILSEVMARLEEENTEAVEELLEEVEEHIEETREAIRVIQRSRIEEKVKTWKEKAKKWRPKDDKEG